MTNLYEVPWPPKVVMEQEETKRFAAMVSGNLRLTSVLAVDRAEAEKKVRKSLNRPGRRQLFLRWVREGCKLMEVIRNDDGTTTQAS